MRLRRCFVFALAQMPRGRLPRGRFYYNFSQKNIRTTSELKQQNRSYQTALMTPKGAENWYAGQTSPVVYLEFAATPASGFVNSASSNWGFTTTFSIMIFSGGTAGSLNPIFVWATG